MALVLIKVFFLLFLFWCSTECEPFTSCSTISVECDPRHHLISISKANASQGLFQSILEHCNAHHKCRVENPYHECVEIEYFCRMNFMMQEIKKASHSEIAVKDPLLGFTSEGYKQGKYQDAENIECNLTVEDQQQHNQMHWIIHEFSPFTSSSKLCLSVKDSHWLQFCSGSKEVFLKRNATSSGKVTKFTIRLADTAKYVPKMRFWIDIKASLDESVTYHLRCISTPVAITSPANPVTTQKHGSPPDQTLEIPSTNLSTLKATELTSEPTKEPQLENIAGSNGTPFTIIISISVLGTFVLVILVMLIPLTIFWWRQNNYHCFKKKSKDSEVTDMNYVYDYTYIDPENMDSRAASDSRLNVASENIHGAAWEIMATHQVSEESKEGTIKREARNDDHVTSMNNDERNKRETIATLMSQHPEYLVLIGDLQERMSINAKVQVHSNQDQRDENDCGSTATLISQNSCQEATCEAEDNANNMYSPQATMKSGSHRVPHELKARESPTSKDVPDYLELIGDIPIDVPAQVHEEDDQLREKNNYSTAKKSSSDNATEESEDGKNVEDTKLSTNCKNHGEIYKVDQPQERCSDAIDLHRPLRYEGPMDETTQVNEGDNNIIRIVNEYTSLSATEASEDGPRDDTENPYTTLDNKDCKATGMEKDSLKAGNTSYKLFVDDKSSEMNVTGLNLEDDNVACEVAHSLIQSSCKEDEHQDQVLVPDDDKPASSFKCKTD